MLEQRVIDVLRRDPGFDGRVAHVGQSVARRLGDLPLRIARADHRRLHAVERPVAACRSAARCRIACASVSESSACSRGRRAVRRALACLGEHETCRSPTVRPAARSSSGTIGRVLRQAAIDDVGECARRVRRNLVQRGAVFVDVRDEHGRRELRVERKSSRQREVADDAERVDVAACVDDVARHLLGAEIVHRAEHLARRRERRRFGQSRDAEVGDERATARAVDENVLSLDVAVDHAARVRVAERLATSRELTKYLATRAMRPRSRMRCAIESPST